jgi:mono/diheme cytochrome c family protein
MDSRMKPLQLAALRCFIALLPAMPGASATAPALAGTVPASAPGVVSGAVTGAVSGTVSGAVSDIVSGTASGNLAGALPGAAAPYKVAGGNKVDAQTLSGWRTWRAMACERCHGAAQEGMVGPSLVNSLKLLTKDEFKRAVLKGRIEKGMPNFEASKMVNENIDNLYAYLKGRSDGAIAPGRLQEIGK